MIYLYPLGVQIKRSLYTRLAWSTSAANNKFFEDLVQLLEREKKLYDKGHVKANEDEMSQNIFVWYNRYVLVSFPVSVLTSCDGAVTCMTKCARPKYPMTTARGEAPPKPAPRSDNGLWRHSWHPGTWWRKNSNLNPPQL